MVENSFEIICIFTAPKNDTSNFEDIPFNPDFFKSASFLAAIAGQETVGSVSPLVS